MVTEKVFINTYSGEGNIGSEKNKNRRCIVISQNNNGETVVVIPLSSTLKKGKSGSKPKYPFHYFLYKSKYQGALEKDSCVKCEDIRCVDKVRIGQKMGNVSSYDLGEIKKRLSNLFGI